MVFWICWEKQAKVRKVGYVMSRRTVASSGNSGRYRGIAEIYKSRVTRAVEQNPRHPTIQALTRHEVRRGSLRRMDVDRVGTMARCISPKELET